jgi:hypothetical protein
VVPKFKRNYIWGYANKKEKFEYHCSTVWKGFADILPPSSGLKE